MESGRVQPSSTVIEPFTMSIIISTCSHEYDRLCLTVVRPQFARHQCMIVLLFPIDSQNVFDLYFLVLEVKIRFQVFVMEIELMFLSFIIISMN